MQRLTIGISGFDAPVIGVPVKDFTAACHAAARQTGGRVHLVRAAYERGAQNFHEVHLGRRDGTEMVRVSCNAHYPIVAFATPDAQERNVWIQFVDCRGLARVLSDTFAVLSVRDACTGVSPAAVANLGEDELKQVRYWNPQRIGDVVFNYWD